eukprot:PITA_06280
MIITGNAFDLIKGIKRLMAQVFEMKDLGSLHYCLGLEVFRDTGQTFLTQGEYARNLLEKFTMDQCRTTATPLQQNLKLSSDDGTKEVDATMYRQLVGSLIYLTTTRPDLAYSISVLSQFMAKPLESHWNAAKSVLRYICAQKDFSFVKERVDEIDEEKMVLKYTNIEGGVLGKKLSAAKFEVKFVPRKEGGCIASWICNYETLPGSQLEESKEKEINEHSIAMLKKIEQYLLSNPSLY